MTEETHAARVPISALASSEGAPEIPARGPWSLGWQRLRADRLALAAGIVLLAILLLCFVGAPVFSHLLGHGPDEPFPYAVSPTLKPVGPWTRVPDVNEFVDIDEDYPRTLFVLGADGTLGRDLFLRVLYGGQASLGIALGATLLALLIGVPLGILSGYLGGWSDWTISRTTELFMGFPVLLFLVAVGYTIGFRYSDVTLGFLPPGVLVLLFLIGIFSWFLPARVMRAQVLGLREEEFVEAARMTGASDLWIMRKHVLPHLTGPIVVWGTLIFAGFVIFEAAISALNVGIRLPTASWGNLLSTNWGTLLFFDPNSPSTTFVERSNWVVFWPTAALFVTVVALALFGEGLRRAIDPWRNE
jgi:ABC-type dipeptide/oligopeptide/nickel transport system permease subunit